MKKLINMLIGTLMISAWVVAVNYLELKLERAETWLYFAGAVLFLASAGFCLLMKDLKKSMIISLACAAVMCGLSQGLIWTALPVVLMFWEYRCVTDRLEGENTAAHAVVFTALSAIYAAAAVTRIVTASPKSGAPSTRFFAVGDICVAVILFAAFVFLAVVCEGRKKRESAPLIKKKGQSGKKGGDKAVISRFPIGYKEMYIQCAALLALSMWVCFAPGVLGFRYTLRMTLYPWLMFVYLTQCRDRALMGVLGKIRSRGLEIVASDVPEPASSEER